MKTRNRTLIMLALAAGLPLAAYAATESTPAKTVTTDNQVDCPYGGPMGPGGYGRRGDFHHHGMMGRGGMMGGGYGMMGDTDEMQERLDEIKDPQQKARFLQMMKLHLDFMQGNLDETRKWVDQQSK